MSLMKYYDYLITLLKTSPKLQIRTTDTTAGVVLGAIGTVFGAVLGGSRGAMMGAVLGSALALTWTKQHKTLTDALDKLSYQEKVKLARQVQELVRGNRHEYLQHFIESEQNCAKLLELLELAAFQNKV